MRVSKGEKTLSQAPRRGNFRFKKSTPFGRVVRDPERELMAERQPSFLKGGGLIAALALIWIMVYNFN